MPKELYYHEVAYVRRLENALREIDAVPISMVNDSESLRHSIKLMQAIARAAIGPKPDLSTVEKRNAFYGSDEYRNMTTAEKCAVQGDGFINDYD